MVEIINCIVGKTKMDDSCELCIKGGVAKCKPQDFVKVVEVHE